MRGNTSSRILSKFLPLECENLGYRLLRMRGIHLSNILSDLSLCQLDGTELRWPEEPCLAHLSYRGVCNPLTTSLERTTALCHRPESLNTMSS